mmetsp:Transcript_22840/g.35238  ORF Transcript_22840/g.35238 Transcript_22840/m.35238 type:complete len:81 (+) Transcript_22840:1-243(+)
MHSAMEYHHYVCSSTLLPFFYKKYPIILFDVHNNNNSMYRQYRLSYPNLAPPDVARTSGTRFAPPIINASISASENTGRP